MSVEVHSEPNVEADTKKFLKLTPQLQETLHELGAKQRPSGSPTIQPRVVSRPSNEIQVANEVNENEPPFRTGHQVFSAMLEQANDIPRAASFHQRVSYIVVNNIFFLLFKLLRLYTSGKFSYAYV